MLLSLWLTGCAAPAPHDTSAPLHDSGDGRVSLVRLHFTPLRGGDTVSVAWRMPPGGGAPEVDALWLPDATDHSHHDALRYGLSVELFDEGVDPAVDVGAELRADPGQHQLLFTGSAVRGPATGDNPEALIEHRYDDEDDAGLPLGLENVVITSAWGEGELTVTLLHLPDKAEGVAEAVAEGGGLEAAGGEVQVSATFSITVQ